MAYCKLCNREVGLRKNKPTLSTALLVILGLMVPLWPITLPFFWGLAILNYVIRSSKVCGLCSSSNWTSKTPASPAAPSELKKAANG